MPQNLGFDFSVQNRPHRLDSHCRVAATFALFTLTIIHFKRAQNPAVLTRGLGAGALADGVLASPSAPRPPAPLMAHLLSARRVDTAWSLQLGWGGVAAALLTALLWLTLSKAMRGAAPPQGVT